MDSKWHSLLPDLIRGIIIGHFSVRHYRLVLVNGLTVGDGFEILTVDRAVKLIDDFREDRLREAHAHRFFVSRGFRDVGCDVHCTCCIDVPRRLHEVLGLLDAHPVLAQLLPSNNRPRVLHARAVVLERSKGLEAFLAVEAGVFDRMLGRDVVTLVEDFVALAELFWVTASRHRGKQPL